MGQAQHRRGACPGKGVERRRLHFDRQHPRSARVRDCRRRFAERRVGRPRRSGDGAQSFAREGVDRNRDKARVSLGELRRRGIMVARPLVPERAFDDDEVRRRSDRSDLTGRGEAE